MLIHEVARQTGLTKKAIEYYCEQGLVSPSQVENGYRDFSQQNIDTLRKIGILRKLGMDTQNIGTVLNDITGEALKQFSVALELNTQVKQMKQAILCKLCMGTSYEDIQSELDALENSTAISQQILQAFPSFYGRFLCLYFSCFLKVPAVTDIQKAAYARIVDFLDNAAAMEFPEELQAFLREAAPACDTAFIHRLIEDNGKLMEAPEQYLRAHRSSIERQLEYRQSDEYRQSPAFQLQEKIIELMRASGYYEVFIPAMKELSPAYAAYTEELAAVNRIFLTMYPEAAKLNT